MKQTNDSQIQRTNKPSMLLSQEENELLFAKITRRCQTMSTAVVQLFVTEAAAHSAWVKKSSGIACFIRDSTKKSYFIRVYCLTSLTMLWEEEMYDDISISRPREFLITFEGQECMVALSFASDAEANVFFKTAIATVSNRSKRRRSKKFSPTRSVDNGYNGSIAPQKPSGTFFQPVAPAASKSFQPFEARKDKKKPIHRGGKLSKADISEPTNFQHLGHIGFGAKIGNDEIETILEEAGISQQQMNDDATREFIYGFLKEKNCLDSPKQKQDAAVPPPVPSRNNNGGNVSQSGVRTAPPPPPAQYSSTSPPVHVTPRPPAQLPTKRALPPARPPPLSDTFVQSQMQAANSPAPPPPPPPPPPPLSTLPSAGTPKLSPSNANPPVQSELAAVPAKADQPSPSGGGAHDNLMREIEKGFKLKPSADRPRERPTSTNDRRTADLAEALREALRQREKALQHSSESEDSEDDDEWGD